MDGKVTDRKLFKTTNKRIKICQLDDGECYSITFTSLDKASPDIELKDDHYPVRAIRKRGVTKTTILLSRLSMYGLLKALNESLPRTY